MAGGEDNNPRRILEAKLHVISSASSSSSRSFIFRAPPERHVNAYEPQIISIGPYHHGKEQLRAMEEHKARYLSKLLQLRHDVESDALGSYIDAAKSMEEKVRNCYADKEKMMKSADFVAMIVLDGLFVVELILKFTEYREMKEDALFKNNSNLSTIAQDLLLLENQLPFFVLAKFADLTGLDEKNFAEKALRFLSGMVPGKLNANNPVVRRNKHLLGILHDNWLPPFKFNLVKLQRRRMLRRGKEVNRYNDEPQVVTGEWNFIRSATELSEAGIRFKKSRENSLFDIEFKKGQFYIPTLTVNHDTERMLRNLIAYEQFNQGFSIVMDYARLMDSLINYAADVALLSKCGIIDNWLGSNEDVANMFNKLNDYVYLSTDNFYYSDIFDDVNEHCQSGWSRCKVNLRQAYFHSPWDWVLTSIVAASILLLLTSVQTIFSVLAYFK